MTNMTFTLDGVDFSALVKSRGYKTQRVPVYGRKVTTKDGVDHQKKLRDRLVVTAPLNDMLQEQSEALCEKLRLHPIGATVTDMDTGEDVSVQLRTVGVPRELKLQERGEDWIAGEELVLEEM